MSKTLTKMRVAAPRRASRQRQRVNDPEGTRRNIVDVATREFAQKGYSGARVDAIAARTRTSKRMIYYYFGGKEALYLAVLEAAYSNIRRIEATLDLERLAPEAALLEPWLMLIDEPSIGLSPLLVNEVFSILKDLRRGGMTILLIEQNARQALAISDHGLVLEQGQTRIEDTAANILADPRIAQLFLGGGLAPAQEVLP